MVSFMAEVIGIRDDMYIGKGHAYMREVAEAVEKGFLDGVLEQRPTVVNLQCDIDHPTQSMADLAHLVRAFGGVEKLKGKKVAMSWAYSPSYGKPLSVPQGVIGLLPRFGMEVSLAHPEGYSLMPEVVEKAKAVRRRGGRELARLLLHGGGLRGRRRRVPEELGALRCHGGADPAGGNGRQAAARRAGEALPGEQRAVQGLGVHREP